MPDDDRDASPGTRELSLLGALLDAAAGHTPAAILKRTAEALAGYSSLRWVELGLYEEGLEEARALLFWPGEGQQRAETRRLPGSLMERAHREGPQILRELSAPGAGFPEEARARREGASALLALPLEDEDGAAGYLLCALAGGAFSEDPRLLALIGKILCVALRHAWRVERVAALSRRAHRESQQLRQDLQQLFPQEELVAVSPEMRKVLEAVSLVARHDTTVLLRGETGTGKEVIARRLHRLSRRAHRVFLQVNCGALPPTLIESELFGHEKGAFTGASARHIGLFERAHGGTLLLDEVAELPASAQVKLLRVLQEGEITRVGGEETRKVDVRIIAATHRPLEELVARGALREDLYFRLNIFPIHIPPLRARRADIIALAEALLFKIAARLGRGALRLSPSSLKTLLSHPWPGNIRELENTLERAAILSTGEEINLSEALAIGYTVTALEAPPPDVAPPRAVPTWEEAARRCIEEALRACGGKIYGKDGAAALLGLKPTTLQSRMKRLGVRGERKRSEGS